MWSIRVSCYLLWAGFGWCLAAPPPAQTHAVPARFYVQLVRGTNDQKPPSGAVKPIGPRLSKCLGSVFRWQSYWEISRQAVDVQPGKTSKVHLDQARDLELAFVPDTQVEVRLIKDGVVARKSRFSSQSMGMEIMGGTQGDDNSWFVVVRRDVPQPPVH